MTRRRVANGDIGPIGRRELPISRFPVDTVRAGSLGRRLVLRRLVRRSCSNGGGEEPGCKGHQRRCGEGGDLLVPHMQPFDLPVTPSRIARAIQTVTDNAVIVLAPCRYGDIGKLISSRSCHLCVLQDIASRQRWRFSSAPSGQIPYDAVRSR